MDQEKRYQYTAECRRGSIDYTYRPLLDVTVSSAHESRTFKALVDSGTEITVMDRAIAELLNISEEGAQKGRLFGVDEWKEGFISTVSLQIEGFDEILHFRVLFIEELNKNFDILLGQQDFFRNYTVRFEKRENMFYLSPTYELPVID